MRPDTPIKEEIDAEVVQEAAEVRERQMTVEEEKLAIEELERQLMAAELAAAQEREQQEKGREISEQIAEAGGS